MRNMQIANDGLFPFFRQGQHQPPGVSRIRRRADQIALRQPVDNALNGRHIHRCLAPQINLRTGLQIPQC